MHRPAFIPRRSPPDPVTATRICTIGYEGVTQGQLIACLRDAGVRLLVDVRDIANSRRPGFAKTALAQGLAAVDIGYLHMRSLGTPKAGRQANRRGAMAEFRAIYADHLATSEAQLGLAELAEIAAETPVCLLCLERDHHVCHRAMVTDALAEIIDVAVVALEPPIM